MTTPKPAPTTNAVEGHDQARPSGRDEPMIDQLERALNDAMNLNRKLKEEYAALQTEMNKLMSPEMKPFAVDEIPNIDLTAARLDKALNANERRMYVKDSIFSENQRTFILWRNDAVLAKWSNLIQAAQDKRDQVKEMVLTVLQHQPEYEADMEAAG